MSRLQALLLQPLPARLRGHALLSRQWDGVVERADDVRRGYVLPRGVGGFARHGAWGVVLQERALLGGDVGGHVIVEDFGAVGGAEVGALLRGAVRWV